MGALQPAAPALNGLPLPAGLPHLPFHAPPMPPMSCVFPLLPPFLLLLLSKQVGFPMLLHALSAAFAAAPSTASSAPVLAGLLQLSRLSGLLGLDRQCEAAVGVLAARCGVFDPAPVGEWGVFALQRGGTACSAGPSACLLCLPYCLHCMIGQLVFLCCVALACIGV